MDWPASADMAEKQNPVDYGVQIRFINDLQEPKKPPKARAKPGSYGVAVRVQGIAGQPFVVLNSGEKGGDSFGVQIKSEGAYTGPAAGPRPPELPPGSVSPDSELPENPYVRRQPSWSTSDEEPGGGVPAPPRHKPPAKRPPREELRRTQSHGNLLTADDDEGSFTPGPPRGQPGSAHQPRALSGTRSSSMLSVAGPPRPAQGEASGFGAAIREPSSDSEAPGRRRPGDADGSDIDTKPLSSVDSLISKFDGKVQQRGRAARRGRIPSEERKRSQSLDGRVSRHAVPDGRELSGAQRGDVRPLPSVPTGSLGREQGARPAEEGAARSQRANRGTEEPPTERLQSKARAELQFKSTPDLLRDQREVAQPGSSEHTKELIYSILKEGSRDSETSLKRKTTLVFEKVQELTVPAKDAACSQPQHGELARKVEELQEQLDKETKLRQKLELTRDPARSGAARALEARLQEAEEESQRLRGALEKKGQELQRSLQELAEAKAARGRAETRLGEREEQLAAMREELGRLREGSGASPDREALYKELLETREELEEALSSKQRQEEHLRLRERELTALKGALKEEVASHDKELDRVRQQYQSDMDQLRRSMEDISQDQANLESEKQKISAVVRNLQRELEESAEETGHWRDMFQKNKDELRTTKQELLQVKLEREEFEEELRELRERFSAVREEADQARSSALDPGELEALRKELRQAQEAQRELAAEKQEQDELLRQRERELQALQGTMREEASSRDGAIERYRRDLQQLQKERDEAMKEKASLESERESSEQARKAVESTLRELQEQKDDLRRKVLGMETQLKEYERMGESWEGSQARLKEKVTKLEAERRQMEESLGESTDREQELLMAKRSLETRLDEAQRSLARLTQEHQELSTSYQEEQRQKEQLKRAKSELEEQKRLLDRTTEKLNKELEQMTEESNSSLAVLKSQLEEFKEKSRKEITDSQKQAKDRGAEVEKMQFSMGRLQDEVTRLKQALQDSQAERESALLDKEVLLQRLHNLEQEADAKRRSQDDRSRQVKALEVGEVQAPGGGAGRGEEHGGAADRAGQPQQRPDRPAAGRAAAGALQPAGPGVRQGLAGAAEQGAEEPLGQLRGPAEAQRQRLAAGGAGGGAAGQAAGGGEGEERPAVLHPQAGAQGEGADDPDRRRAAARQRPEGPAEPAGEGPEAPGGRGRGGDRAAGGRSQEGAAGAGGAARAQRAAAGPHQDAGERGLAQGRPLGRRVLAAGRRAQLGRGAGQRLRALLHRLAAQRGQPPDQLLLRPPAPPEAPRGTGRRRGGCRWAQEAVHRHGGRGVGLSRCLRSGGVGGPQPPGPCLASSSSCGSQGTKLGAVEAATWWGRCGPGELPAGVGRSRRPPVPGAGGHGHRDTAAPGGAGSCWVSVCLSPLAAPAAPEAPIYFCTHQPSTLRCSFPSQSAILNKNQTF